MSSVRVFLGVPLTEQLQNAIRSLQGDLKSRIRDIRWSRPGNLHLTCTSSVKPSRKTLKRSGFLCYPLSAVIGPSWSM